MSVCVLIERIRNTLAAGELERTRGSEGYGSVTTMADLVRPWEEVFPGAQRPDLNLQQTLGRHISLNQPCFFPSPKTSKGYLPPPRKIDPQPQAMHPGLFDAVKGIWDYYVLKKKKRKDLLKEPFNEKGLQNFVDPLWSEFQYMWPLEASLERLGEESPLELETIGLDLPCLNYDEEGAGTAEAFLLGERGVQGIMEYLETDNAWQLPIADVNLIAEVGWKDLCQVYYYYTGKKSYDLGRLEDTENSYFKKVKEKYPSQYEEYGGTLIASEGLGIDITCAEDISFAIAYSTAFETMLSELPPYYNFEEEPEHSANFAHELCNIWRKEHKQKEVKWSYVEPPLR